MNKLKISLLVIVAFSSFAKAGDCKGAFKTEQSKVEKASLKSMEEALQNNSSLKKYLKTHSVNAQNSKTGDTLLHLAVSTEAPIQIIETLIVNSASPYILNKKKERVITSKVFENYIQEILETHKPDQSKRIYSVYLAGPEVFLKYAFTAGNFIKAQARLLNTYKLKNADYNIEGIFPFDAGYVPKNMDFQDGMNIYQGNINIMDRADAVIANMVKFRGAGMDGGTAFEMGYMTAKGNMVIGYYDEKPYFDEPKANRTYVEKVEEEMGPSTKVGESYYDKNGLNVEGFGMNDNLMMVGATTNAAGRAHIADSSWGALLLVKKKFDSRYKSLNKGQIRAMKTFRENTRKIVEEIKNDIPVQ